MKYGVVKLRRRDDLPPSVECYARKLGTSAYTDADGRKNAYNAAADVMVRFNNPVHLRGGIDPVDAFLLYERGPFLHDIVRVKGIGIRLQNGKHPDGTQPWVFYRGGDDIAKKYLDEWPRKRS